MTTASVLLTVGTAWSASSDKYEKEQISRATWNVNSVAHRELRETAATREQALLVMREWLRQNMDVRNVRMDDSFLLRFLRHKKFSIMMAQQTLLKYLNFRKYYPECFSNLDCEDSKVEEIFKDGYIMVSPIRDSKGRRIIIYTMSKFNATKFCCWDMVRAHAVLYETLLEDPIDQICGFTHVGDGSGVTSAHVASWKPTDFARLMKWGEQSMPMRQKECHLINLPSAVKYIIDFAASMVTTKMSERLHIHTSLNQLHKRIDPESLPTSFGGKISVEDMISFTRQLLQEQRKKLIGLDDMEIVSTRGIISTKCKGGVKGDAVSIEGSFRKLEID